MAVLSSTKAHRARTSRSGAVRAAARWSGRGAMARRAERAKPAPAPAAPPAPPAPPALAATRPYGLQTCSVPLSDTQLTKEPDRLNLMLPKPIHYILYNKGP